jgi:hypothetical protein
MEGGNMILIASPCGYIINRNFIECREDAQRHIQIYGYRVITKLYQGVGLSENRNLAMFDAYHSKVDWLIFIDTDMEFSPQDVQALMDNGGDVVTGVCKTGEGKYALYEYDDKTNRIKSIDPKPIVDICGAAFIGIRRNVVEKLCDGITRNMSWKNTRVRETNLNLPFNLVANMDGIQFSEDVSFCLRLRELGIPIHVAMEAKIGHEKIVCIK